MRRLRLILPALLIAGTMFGQITASSVERIPLPTDVEWLAPRFSPDGTKIYLTSTGYTGIWEYTRATGRVRQLTADRGAGFGFAISPDGRRLAYRRLGAGSSWRTRQQEVVTVELATGKSAIESTGRDLSLPSFTGSVLTYATGKNELRTAAPLERTEVSILGIEETRITVVLNGEKKLLDPLGNGSYIWPALSPDQTRIVAYEMSRGAFVCDLNGRVLARLGKRDAPSWTRDGRWLVYMDDRDDGHQVLSSDLYAVSDDGGRVVRLTDTPGEVEMYPQCSPVENRIVFSTLNGRIGMVTYEEGAR